MEFSNSFRKRQQDSGEFPNAEEKGKISLLAGKGMS